MMGMMSGISTTGAPTTTTAGMDTTTMQGVGREEVDIDDDVAEEMEVSRRIVELQQQIRDATSELADLSASQVVDDDDDDEEPTTTNTGKNLTVDTTRGPNSSKTTSPTKSESSNSPISVSSSSPPNNNNNAILTPPYKSGYLSKWNDRAIGGFTGTKAWDKRFIILSHGRLAYYKTHVDPQPRYILSLRHCAVRDDGSKPVKTMKLNPAHLAIGSEPVEGKFYHVFSIYQRPMMFGEGGGELSPRGGGGYSNDEGDCDDVDNNVMKPMGGKLKRSMSAEFDDENQIVPLLKFSTQSLAEKNSWMDLITQGCAYAELVAEEEEGDDDRNIDFFANLRRGHGGGGHGHGGNHSPVNPHSVPKAKPGTLAPIYYAPPATSEKRIRKMPSGVNLKDFRREYKSRGDGDSARSNPRAISGYPPSRPMHRSSNPSYLSSEAEVQNFRGLLNLALIVLAVSNIRIILDTIRKHGNVLLSLPTLTDDLYLHFREAPLEDFPFISGLLLNNLFLVLAYGVEYLLSRRWVGERIGMMLHSTVSTSSLLIPTNITWYHIPDPVRGATLLLYSTVLWMKLVSYSHANSDYRFRAWAGSNNNNRKNKGGGDQHRKGGDGSSTNNNAVVDTQVALVRDLDEDEAKISYPANVTLGNMYYFWFAPTLTYQMAFPRIPGPIRWAKIVGIIFRLLISSALLIYLVAQIIQPNLDNLVRDIERDGGVITLHLMGDYLLKLSIANTYVWLLVFYTYFHLFLNLCAELTRFGDRVFYKDWWNASEISSYWRLWNMPVHYWLVRHVYFPSVRRGMSRNGATFMVFFVSAIMHELLLSVPFHFVRAWSFLGMMGQIPLSAMTKYLDRKLPGTSWGNIIFWLTFCIVGQPMAILMYTIDYWNVSKGGMTTTSLAAAAGGVACQGAKCEL